jgi:DNA-binding MarR family transcriptional regulator
MTGNTEKSVQTLADKVEATNKEMRVQTFLWLLFTTDVVARYLDTHLSKYRVSRTGFSVLNTLVTHAGTMKPTEISKIVFRTKHTITRTVDELEKRGLVERKTIGQDRRTRQVAITSKGLNLVRAALPDMRQVSRAAISSLEEEQVSQLNNILKRLAKDLLIQMAEDTRSQSHSHSQIG